MRYGIIYKATSPSNKVYIGQTIVSLRKRKINHCNNAFNKNSRMYNTKLSRAIRKYGIGSFYWEIIYTNIPEQDIFDLEISVIQKHDSFKNGYNSTSGGEGCIGRRHSHETKAKMSSSAKKGPRSEETKLKISKATKGRLISKSHRAKISKALTGKSRPKSVANKISKSNSGENAYHSKLTWKEIREIRSKYIPKKYTTTMLAKEYGVSKNNIFDIISGKTWKE